MPDRAARTLLASATGPELVFLGFVLELAPCTALWERLRQEHVPTTGGLCASRFCGRPGYGSPVIPWPCTVASLADWAHLTHSRR
jgi:hypothetical protein